VDEAQHFNKYRALTLRSYLDSPVAFDREAWLEACDEKKRLEGGGFAVPKPPLFPGDDGRHKQRAFRDALCDLLPPEYGFHPTARIAHFEAAQGVESLLRFRLAGGSADSESDTFPIGEHQHGRNAIGESSRGRTQRVTKNDLRTGQVRVPSSAKHLFPQDATTVTVVLRGWETQAPWRPRFGPDRERSGVLRIGSQDLVARVAVDEVLDIALDKSDRINLD